MTADHYLSVANISQGEYREKGSKFLAFLYPFTNDSQLEKVLSEIKSLHPKARHFCYSYRVGITGDIFRINDDGEPSGTAGKPIHGQLLSKHLSDVICVVVRYFGGTKLGASGLIRAYKTAASEAIATATIVDKFIYKTYSVTTSFDKMGVVINELKNLDFEILRQEFNNVAHIQVQIRKSKANRNIKQFKANLLGWSVNDVDDETELEYCSIKEMRIE